MSDQKDNWVEAGVNDKVWKPEAEGDKIQGVYHALKTEVGMNKSNVYLIKTGDEDEPTSVWGSTVLDARFEEIPIGSEVMIEYLGDVKGKGPKPYKNYKVLYRQYDPFKG